MTLEEAIAEANKRAINKAFGKPASRIVWHVVSWNNEYALYTHDAYKKHKNTLESVYNTKPIHDKYFKDP